ncbi:MAG: hypothetical protein IJE09_08220 [Oscillospiraceae bacterium]|nr:hypothetical protein [Oscillospiraceae bacterium]
MKKRIFSFLLVLVFVLSMSGISAFAYDYYLDFGDVDVVAENHYGMDFQVVHIGDYSVPDFDPTITQWDPNTPTNNDIDVDVYDGATAKLTIKNIYYESTTGGTFFDINGEEGDSVVLTVEGYNYVGSYDEGDEGSEEDDAIIEVEDENLTIKGNGILYIEGDTNGAKIGSDGGSYDEYYYEYVSGTEFSGKIHITDNVAIYTSDDGSGDGAAIGSGQYADFTGTVIIDGNANVTAMSNDRGAGIGAGEGSEAYDYDEDDYVDTGDFRGTVVIGGNAMVWAEGDDDSAGIGSGQDGSFSGGKIIIKDNAMVWAEGSNEGPAIGAADDTYMDGDIIIKDNAVVFVDRGSDCDTDIGAEGEWENYGSILILGNASIISVNNDSETGDLLNNLVIGGEEYYDDVEVIIGENVKLNGLSSAQVLAGLDLGTVDINSDYKEFINGSNEDLPAYLIAYGEDGGLIPYTLAMDGDTVTITVDLDYAELQGNKQAFDILLNCGFETLRIVTNSGEIEFDMNEFEDWYIDNLLFIEVRFA